MKAKFIVTTTVSGVSGVRARGEFDTQEEAFEYLRSMSVAEMRTAHFEFKNGVEA